MAKFARVAVLLLAALGLGLFLLPAEAPPPTGAWLVREGLKPQTARVGRFDLRYVRAGKGPTVILVHGILSSIYSWADVIPALAPSFDVVALDLPGFGQSSQPEDLAFDDYLPVVTGLMDALGIEKAHLAGNSMGGAISLLVAARVPSRVDRLVILDSAGFKLAASDRPFVVRLAASPALGAVTDRVPVKRLMTRATLRQLMRDHARVTEERIDEYVAPLLRPGALASTRSLLRSRLVLDLASELPRIQAPTLVIWGRYDPWLPESDADRFLALIPGARKAILETGHMPQEERPAEVARLMKEFFTS